MAVLFSHITLSAENGSTETFLCGGIPENEEALENWTAYQNFLEDNPEIESIDVEVKSFLYGEGEIVDAGEESVSIEWVTREAKPVGKGKINVTHNATLLYSDIKKATIVIKF